MLLKITDYRLKAIDLNKFHPLINTTTLHRIRSLDFAACKRENFTHGYLRSSPMYVMPLDSSNEYIVNVAGIFKSILGL